MKTIILTVLTVLVVIWILSLLAFLSDVTPADEKVENVLTDEDIEWMTVGKAEVDAAVLGCRAIEFSKNALPLKIEFRNRNQNVMGTIVVNGKGLTLNFHELNINIVLPEKPTTTIHYKN